MQCVVSGKSLGAWDAVLDGTGLVAAPAPAKERQSQHHSPTASCTDLGRLLPGYTLMYTTEDAFTVFVGKDTVLTRLRGGNGAGSVQRLIQNMGANSTEFCFMTTREADNHPILVQLPKRRLIVQAPAGRGLLCIPRLENARIL